ncbi:MAG: nucleotide sugar dehydrogenase [Desulfurococcales archaeon]|nr:nucleotide sugar dehydrogenase [Desulfurococcales archaeon]
MGTPIDAISVIGLGYVGLPTAVVFASRGVRVVGVDVDGFKVNSINRGVSYINEPGLGGLLAEVVSRGLLSATTDIDTALDGSDAVLIDVPTPIKNGVADLSYVADVSRAISRRLRRGMLVVVESTLPPGATGGLVRGVLEEGSGLRVGEDFYLAHVPERIAPGRALEELSRVPRLVGGVDARSTERALELYSRVNPNLLPTDATTAEFVKLAENTFRDLNIAFANLLAVMAENLGIDVYDAIRLANTHPRVNIHWPGAGVGGPCLTKDPYMLASVSDFWGVELIRMARRLNEYMPHHTVEIVEKVARMEGINLGSSRIAVLGVAYKGGVDDTRESPARVVVSELVGRGVDVVTYDPYTSESFGAERAGSLEEAMAGADMVLIITDHPEFRELDWRRLGKLMRRRIIVDGRRVLEPSQAVAAGFRYYGIGFGRVWRI